MKTILLKCIVASVLTLTNFSIFAAPVQRTDAVELSELTPEQVAEVKAKVSELKSTAPLAKAAAVSETVRKEAGAWGELGANMGKAIVGAASEVGVAAADFAKTDLGKVITAIVIFKLVGSQALGVFFGILVFTLGGLIVYYLLTSNRLSKRVKYVYVPVFWGMFNRKKVESVEEDGDYIVGRLLSAGIVCLVTLLVGLNCVF